MLPEFGSLGEQVTGFLTEADELLRPELESWAEGFCFIAGVDEVGRGPLAGPVVAGAVILPKDCRILYINDSKKLSAKTSL